MAYLLRGSSDLGLGWPGGDGVGRVDGGRAEPEHVSELVPVGDEHFLVICINVARMASCDCNSHDVLPQFDQFGILPTIVFFDFSWFCKWLAISRAHWKPHRQPTQPHNNRGGKNVKEKNL